MNEEVIGRESKLLSPDRPKIGGRCKTESSGLRGKSAAAEVWRFLRTGPETAARVLGHVPADDIPQIHRALELVFPGIERRRAFGWDEEGKANCWGPDFQLFSMADGEAKLLLTSGVMLCECPASKFSRLVVILRFDRNSWPERLMVLELIGPAGAQAIVQQKFRELKNSIETLPHYLKGQLLNYDGHPLTNFGQRLTLDDVALPERTRTQIRQNTVDLLSELPRYRQWRIPLTRGVLLHGPPGNGKTMIGRALAGMGLATFFQVNPEPLAEGGFNRLFKLARRLAPTILFFEDLDFVAGQKLRSHGSARLAELLVQMDGLERNDGVIVIATTNEPEQLDPAIKERPSRFDVTIEIGPPDYGSRQAILAGQLKGLASPEVILAGAKVTAGLSGAQVKETAISACQLAIQGNLQPGQLQLAHVESALAASLLVRRPRPVGFDV